MRQHSSNGQRIADWLAGDEVRWDPMMSWGHHPAGTTRMAHSPRAGVVDGDSRIHGFSNIYLAGSSVFPTCGYANPTFTIVAMALRLADQLERVIKTLGLTGKENLPKSTVRLMTSVPDELLFSLVPLEQT